jgi:hypothetical protein
LPRRTEASSTLRLKSFMMVPFGREYDHC